MGDNPPDHGWPQICIHKLILSNFRPCATTLVNVPLIFGVAMRASSCVVLTHPKIGSKMNQLNHVATCWRPAGDLQTKPRAWK